PADTIRPAALYWVTGCEGGALGAFKWRALGAAGVPGAARVLADGLSTEGAALKPEPFLMRRSPLSVVRTILEEPEPIFPVTVLFSSPLTSNPNSVTMSPLWVRPSMIAAALGGS